MSCCSFCGMALIWEKVSAVFGAVIQKGAETVHGEQTLRVYISNNYREDIRVEEVYKKYGDCKVSFESLSPGKAGVVHCSGSGQYGIAVRFRFGSEVLMLATYTSWRGSNTFAMDFVPSESSDTDPSRYYGRMPSEFMGDERAQCALGKSSTAAVYVEQAMKRETDSVAHVFLTARDDLEVSDAKPTAWSTCTLSPTTKLPGASNSFSLLVRAEACIAERNHKALARTVFLMEYIAVQAGIDGLRLRDKAFALNLLIHSFIVTGICDLSERALKYERKKWEEAEPLAFKEDQEKRTQYDAYLSLAAGKRQLEQYVDAALILVKSTAMNCVYMLGRKDVFRPRPRRHRASMWGSQRIVSASVDDEDREMLRKHLVGSSVDLDSKASDDDVAQMQAIIQQCVQDTTSFQLRWLNVFQSLRQCFPRSATKLDAYCSLLAGAKRFFQSDFDENATFESWGGELFASLGEPDRSDTQTLQNSMGYGAQPYKVMSTNSKSGEMFFFSADKRFIIKTVSEAEALLLHEMLPGYGNRLRADLSLLVRYGGLYCIKIPGQKNQYVTIMLSVFDPSIKLDETYDVKGSMHKRKKKEGESVGKDEDWVAAGKRIAVTPSIRRELRAAHEMDAAFLREFGLMDYSLLIGINSKPGHAAGTGWRDPCGVWSADSSQIYFIGLIDFLIEFGLKKQAEHAIKAATGHATDASCVDPDFYATRQVEFVQNVILEVQHSGARRRRRCKYGRLCYRRNAEHKEEFAHPGDIDWDATADLRSGTLGMLHVTFIAAHNVRKADLFSASDPYAVGGLGLQRVRTPTAQDTHDPEWNHHACLAVDKAHGDMDLVLSVWDEDRAATQGSDDRLGIARIPISQIMKEQSMECRKSFQDGSQGEISLRVQFQPV